MENVKFVEYILNMENEIFVVNIINSTYFDMIMAKIWKICIIRDDFEY